MRAALERIEASGTPSSKVMIVGAGYAGVEMASVVAERMAGKAQVGPAPAPLSPHPHLQVHPRPLHNFVPIPHLRARSLTHLLAHGCCLTPLPSLPPSFSLPWQVQLVAPHYDILDGCPEGQRLAAKKVLAGLGVEIITGA